MKKIPPPSAAAKSVMRFPARASVFQNPPKRRLPLSEETLVHLRFAKRQLIAFESQPELRSQISMHAFTSSITPPLSPPPWQRRLWTRARNTLPPSPIPRTGKPLDGSKTYKIHLPPNIPAKDFWSFVVYDNQTRSMLQTDQQFPSIGSQKQGVVVNPDTSVDVWFGLTALSLESPDPTGCRPFRAEGWNVLIRLYGPGQSWFDKTWKPGRVRTGTVSISRL